MNMNTNTVVSNQNRGRIAFWNILAYMFAGLAAFTLIRGGHDLVANIATAVLATLMLLCLLARFSVQYPDKFKIVTRVSARADADEASEEEDTKFYGVNPATGRVMHGWTDTSGHAFGSGTRSTDD